MKPIIIIPARNEKDKIASVISSAKKYGDVVVVDDGSTDNTYAVAESEGALVLHHVVNLGKGAALKTGCDYAVLNGIKKIVVIDADAQHDPAQIPEFIEKLDGNDIVFGRRSFSSNMPLILKFGNNFINKTASVLYGVSLNDMLCGYRAFTIEAYKKIRWRATDYSVESEMVRNAGKHKLRYAEIPIKTVYHDNYKGTTVLDGIRIVLKMLWWKVAY